MHCTANWRRIHGRTITLEAVEIYTTYTSVKFSLEEDSDAHNLWLDVSMTNRSGEQINVSGEGYQGVGNKKERTMYFESVYFTRDEGLILSIDKWSWEETAAVQIDLDNGAVVDIPDGIVFEKATQQADGSWVFNFASGLGNGEKYIYSITDEKSKDEYRYNYWLSDKKLEPRYVFDEQGEYTGEVEYHEVPNENKGRLEADKVSASIGGVQTKQIVLYNVNVTLEKPLEIEIK